MARSYLTTKEEQWLYNNYSSKSNQELAEILTGMVEKNNEQRIARLEEIMKDVTQMPVIRSIQSELKWRRAFKGFSASYIKHVGMRIKCRGKSFEHVSSSNREKAKATNIKRWLKIAHVIDNPTEWLLNFRKNETRICLLQNEGDLRKLRNAIFYFNRNISNSSGYFFSSNHISEANLLRVVSIPNNCRR